MSDAAAAAAGVRCEQRKQMLVPAAAGGCCIAPARAATHLARGDGKAKAVEVADDGVAGPVIHDLALTAAGAWVRKAQHSTAQHVSVRHALLQEQPAS
jgi:hypothetical protein